MLVKGTKQLGNFKRGINIYVPKRISTTVAGAAGGGIVVASALAVRIVSSTHQLDSAVDGRADKAPANENVTFGGWNDDGYYEVTFNTGPNSNFRWSGVFRQGPDTNIGSLELVPPGNTHSLYSPYSGEDISHPTSVSYWRMGGIRGIDPNYFYTNPSTDPTIVPLTGWVLNPRGNSLGSITIQPLWISTASAQTIYLTSSETAYGITSEYYGGGTYYEGSGDWKLVWSGTRWEIRGDNNSLAYYSLASVQSADWFPREQSWFTLSNSQTITLTFSD